MEFDVKLEEEVEDENEEDEDEEDEDVDEVDEVDKVDDFVSLLVLLVYPLCTSLRPRAINNCACLTVQMLYSRNHLVANDLPTP